MKTSLTHGNNIGKRANLVTSLVENIRTALTALIRNGMRSILTMSGIVIGVLAIVTLIAVLKGVRTEITKQVEGLGANLVIVVPGKLEEGGQPNPMALMGLSSLTDADSEALRKVPGVAQTAPVRFLAGSVEADGKDPVSAMVVGTNKAGIQMNPTPLAEGRYLNDDMEDAEACVIGEKPREQLFGKSPVLGKTIIVQSRHWKVVGVLGKTDNSSSFGNMMEGLKNIVYIPERTAKKIFKESQINRIIVKTDYQHPANEMIGSVQTSMLSSHKNKEDFGLITSERGLALVTKLIGIVGALLGLIAAISLFVAGIGIMNIMLVTVTERTREIGIRKTVGARRQDIFMQFVIEAIMLSIAGGVIGILLSATICKLISKFSPLTPIISFDIIALALGVCTFVGVVFGVAPAVRASRLDPIDALRYE